jgi:hypothetical protein
VHLNPDPIASASEHDPAFEREIFDYATKNVTDVPVAGAVSKEVKWVNDHGQPVTFVNDNGEPVKWTTNAPQRASVQSPQEPVLKDQTFGVGEANGTADVSGAAGTVSRAAGNANACCVERTFWLTEV